MNKGKLVTIALAGAALILQPGCTHTQHSLSSATDVIEVVPESIRAALVKKGLAKLTEEFNELKPYMPALFAAVDKAYADHDTSEKIVESILSQTSTIITNEFLLSKVMGSYEETLNIGTAPIGTES